MTTLREWPQTGSMKEMEARLRRERLAAAALQGILSEGVEYGEARLYRAAARDAVKFADALIKELDKPPRKKKGEG